MCCFLSEADVDVPEQAGHGTARYVSGELELLQEWLCGSLTSSGH